MSETASAGSGAQASTGAESATSETSVTPSQTTNESQKNSASTNQETKAQSKTKGGEANTESEFEEISIGSIKGKVPKAMATALKNLERGFHTKSQEAAAKEKLLSLAKDNPKEFYKQTGKDVYEFAEEVLAEKYELMNMDPKERELRELKAQMAERDAKETSSKQEVLDALKEFGPLPNGAEKASREELIQYYRQQKQVYTNTQKSLDQEMGEAFKESGLSPDKHLIAKVAFEISSALKRGKSLSAKDAIANISKEYYSGAKDHFGKMDVKRIHEIFGDEFLNKIRQYDLTQATANAASRFGQASQSPGQSPASENNKKYVNQAEYRKLMGIS